MMIGVLHACLIMFLFLINFESSSLYFLNQPFLHECHIVLCYNHDNSTKVHARLQSQQHMYLFVCKKNYSVHGVQRHITIGTVQMFKKENNLFFLDDSDRNVHLHAVHLKLSLVCNYECMLQYIRKRTKRQKVPNGYGNNIQS